MLMAAWAKFVIGFNAVHVLATAVADPQGCGGEHLFTLNGCIKLAHGFVSFGVVDHHAPSLHSISATVNPLGQIFSFFFLT